MKKVLILFVLAATYVQSQDALPFADEVEVIQKKYDSLWDSSKETTVFTGSSSVRMWHDLQERFPDQQIVNSGFGGSQASDLLNYTHELIVRYKPKKVFIYEGDNDISAGKNSKVIISDIAMIINKVRKQIPSVQIVLIAAKPSMARWNLKRSYRRLNRKFKKMSGKDADITFADVWKPMLEGKKLKQGIFIEDGLHMNAEGYEIWYDTLKPFME